MKHLFTCLSLMFLMHQVCSAAIITWNGSVDSLWANDNNWNGGVAAGAGDTAIIPNTVRFPYVPTLTTVNVRKIIVQTSARLIIGPSGILNAKYTDNHGTIEVFGFFQFTSTTDPFTNFTGALTEVKFGGKMFFAEVPGVCFDNKSGSELKNNGTMDFNTVDKPFSGTGIISGNGIFEQTTINGTSTFSPGTSPGNMTFNAGLMLQDSGGFFCELFSLTSFDTLSGTDITLGGTLTIELNGYTPTTGDFFKIVQCVNCSGVFDSLSLPALPINQQWHVGYGNEATVLLVADSSDIIWEGQGDDQWTNDSNWKGGSAPGMNESALIAPGPNQPIIQNGINIVIGKLEVLPCSSFEVVQGGEISTN